jgi:hypothetical protein
MLAAGYLPMGRPIVVFVGTHAHPQMVRGSRTLALAGSVERYRSDTYPTHVAERKDRLAALEQVRGRFRLVDVEGLEPPASRV